MRGYTGLSVERPAGDFGRGMSTSGVRIVALHVRAWVEIEHLTESLLQIGTAKSMSRKHIADLLNEANRLLTEIRQQIDKVIY